MANLFPIVMPLYDRKFYLSESITAIASWAIPKIIYFFQDNLPSGSSASCQLDIDDVRIQAIDLCKYHNLPFKFVRRCEHLGIRKNITMSISETFEISSYLFCVEDDVIVSPSFPEFCLKHLNIEKHLIINANSFSSRQNWADVLVANDCLIQSRSSWCSSIFRSWGWFCSKYIWQDYFPDLKLLMTDNIEKKLSHLPLTYINTMRTGAHLCNSYELDSWAVPFQYYLWHAGKKVLTPFINMSSHIGTNGTHFTRESNDLRTMHYQRQPYYNGPINDNMLQIASDEVSMSREIDENSYIFGGNKYLKLKDTYLRDFRNRHMEFSSIH